jgi:hypothetical protein
LHRLTDDVVFKLAVAGDVPVCYEDSGKQAVVDYCEALGGIVTFWQVELFDMGGQVLVLGKESFHTERRN